jgi:hypothetical protein
LGLKEYFDHLIFVAEGVQIYRNTENKDMSRAMVNKCFAKMDE